ncbi:MAG: aminopeptidase P family protein [Bdellovibrionales bacterium]|nr:aminopeptidase P family protein [Bdellovibrionales bacterium]
MNKNFFKQKRKQIAKALPKNSLLALSSYPKFLRQVDVYYPYRQESYFYYLTGFKQEESLFLLFSSSHSVLFIKDKDFKKEIWDGIVYNVDEVKEKYGIDEVLTLSQMDLFFSKKIKGIKHVFYNKGLKQFDKKIKSLNIKFQSAYEFLRPFRQIKSLAEIQSLKKACSYSIQAHKEVAKVLKPGSNERALHAVFIHSIMKQGAQREAYPGIFASGKNALILHYIKNNSVCKKGDLLLVDAGAESDYYASDITRVYPVNGKFSKKQKQIYQLLLKLQKQLINYVKPGVSLKTLNEKMSIGLTEILLEIGLLTGSFKENLVSQKYKSYCPHSVGHFLGLDVHDVFKKGDSVLKENMVLTIEPGIYIDSKDKKAPQALRGLGLRIEDDILVTKSGSSNLSIQLAKESDEIEELCSL